MAVGVASPTAHGQATIRTATAHTDPYVSAERARQLGVVLVGGLDELLRQADFLTIHLPKTSETIGLIDAEMLRHAKPTLR